MKFIISEKSNLDKIKDRLEKISSLLPKGQFDDLQRTIFEFHSFIRQNPNVSQEYVKIVKVEHSEVYIIIKNSKLMNILERLFCI